MRPLEIVVILAALVAVGLVPFRFSRSASLIAAVLALGFAALHVVVEGPRWQMYPIYALLVGLVFWRFGRLGTRSDHRPLLPSLAAVAVVAIAGGLAAALPVASLPSEAGPMPVGTTSWTIVDDDRIEVYDDSGSQRRFVAQAWYPIAEPGPPGPWVANAAAFSSAVAPSVRLPPFALRHLDLVETPATPDVPIAPGSWPVVVYSHGWGGFRTIQSDYAEFLASRGYVVLSLDHTYGSAVTLFPDDGAGGGGEAVQQNLGALPSRDEVGEAAYQTAITLLEETFAEDVAETLDQLSAGQGPSLLGSGLQLEKVGLSGHSTGGGAMIRLCLLDNRCGSVLGFDPWVEPIPDELLARGLNSPLLSIRSEDWAGNDNDAVLTKLHADSPGSEGLSVIPGTTHTDFTLQPFLSPLSEAIGVSGPADDDKVHAAVNVAALGFFDRTIRNIDGATTPPVIEID